MGDENKTNIIETVSKNEVDHFLALYRGDVDAAIASIKDRVAATNVLRSTPPPSSGESIIEVSDLSKTYKIGKQKIEVLKKISLTIYKSEIVALTGPSGSGKSTLLHLLGCIDTPTSGSITIGDKDISKLSDSKLSSVRQEKVGFVFQSFYLQPFLKMDDNVAVPAMFTDTQKPVINERVQKFIDQVGLSQYIDHYPKELSGGQVQRAAIARALINNPEIIIADEPTGNLDSKNSQSIIELFKNLRDTLGTTIIIATHDPGIAKQADRVIVVRDGELA